MKIKEIRDWLSLTMAEQSEMIELGNDCTERYNALIKRIVTLEKKIVLE